ncbi:MAG: sigma-54 dependent transcriptional regulator [Desulfobacterales bacterium]|nr:sigma-54 dependent transcriptional regulator [Desulfobacterales bacterium]
METPKILIVEDEINSSIVFSRILEKGGYTVDCVYSAEEAVPMISKGDYDLLMIDVVLPGMDGLALLKKVKKTDPDILTVVVTAYGSINLAVKAVQAGANDFLEKPVIPEKILHVMNKVFEAKRLRDEVATLRSNLSQRYRFANIIGKHRKMRQIFQLIGSLADTISPVMITGETGTGKDLVARAIHYQSRRKDKPFIAINCAALPENLLESELFGYERGAFTGANKQKIGKIEQAEGGTLFLDEIGDTPMGIQAKLLRAVQTKKIERLGGSHPISLDIRIIAATNKNLSREIAEKRFRMDFFYRLNVVPITIPPLRERMEDLPLLVDHFLEKQSLERNVALKISEKAMSRLMAHPWPGNIRELENVLERAMIFNRGAVIEDVLFSDLKMETPVPGKPTDLTIDTDLPLSALRESFLSRLEKEYLTQLLEKFQGSIKNTAAHAGIDVRTVRRKMKEFKLDKWDFKV